MSVTDSQSPRFDIGRVMSRTSSLIGRNFVPFAILSLVFAGVPYLLLLLAMPASVAAGSDLSTAPFIMLVVLLVYLLASLVLQAALTRASVDDLSGKPVAIGAAVSTGVAVLLPLIGLGLVVGGVVMIGALVFGVLIAIVGMGGMGWMVFVLSIGLIVAAVYIFLRWLVAGPIIVVERLGVFASLGRSTALTQNHRWAILGLLVLYAIVIIVLQLVVGLIVPGAGAALAGTSATTPPLIALIVLILMQVFVSMLITVGIASVYFELRQLKDGVGVHELAQVFA